MDDSLECIFCKKKLVALKLYKFFRKDKEQNGRVCEICAKKFVPLNETEKLKLVHSEENKLSTGAFPSSLKEYLDNISSENKPTVKHSARDIVKQAAIESGIFDEFPIIDEQGDLNNSSDRKHENNVNITKAFDSVSHNTVHSEENKLSSGVFPSSSKKYLDNISSENKPTVKHSAHDIIKQAAIESGIFDEFPIIDEQGDLNNSSDRKHENNVNITKAFDSVSHNTAHSEENKLSSGVFPSSSKKYLDSSSENKPTVKHSAHDIVEQAAIASGIGGLLIIGEERDLKNSSDRKHESNANIVNTFDSISHKMKKPDLCKIFPSHDFTSNKSIIRHSCHDQVEQESVTGGLFVIDNERYSKNSSDRKHESNVNIVNTFDSVSHEMKKPNVVKISPKQNLRSNKSIIRHSSHDQITQEPVTESVVTDERALKNSNDRKYESNERYLKNSSDSKHESNVNIVNTFDSVSHEMKKPNVVKIVPKQNLRSNKSIIRHSSHDQITQEPVTESVVTDELLVIDEERALKNSNDRKYESNVNIINAFDNISLKIEKPNPPKLSSISNKSIRHLSHDEIRQEPVIDNEATDGLPVIDLKYSSDKTCESNINIVNVSDTISQEVQKPSMGELCPEQNSMSNKSSVRHSFQNEVKQELQIESEESDGSLIIDEDREV